MIKVTLEAKVSNAEEMNAVNYVVYLVNYLKLLTLEDIYECIHSRRFEYEDDVDFGMGGSHIWMSNKAGVRLIIVTK